MVFMIDSHDDLLTIAYVCYLKNDSSYLEKISHSFNENNVAGLFANLYFMGQMEMFEELHPKYYQENISVLEMFKISKKILDFYLPDTNILYSLEWADYIKNPIELEQLYYEGLNALTLKGMISTIKEKQRKGIDVCCYASHSNSRSLCSRKRNLSDEQLKEIKNIHGLVGIFLNRNFLV